MMEIGGNILSGLWDGISNGVANLMSGIGDVCNDIWNGFKDFFGIHSPSKLMRKELGNNIVLGLVDGIQEKTKTAVRAVNNLGKSMMGPVKSIADNIGSGLNDFSVDANGNPVSGRNIIVFNQNNYSPKSLSRIDIYRQTKNQLAFAEAPVFA